MHNDLMNITLAVGDRVVYTEHETSQLYFGSVIGFTPKKVKVRREGGWDSLKDPSRLLKVPQ